MDCLSVLVPIWPAGSSVLRNGGGLNDFDSFLNEINDLVALGRLRVTNRGYSHATSGEQTVAVDKLDSPQRRSQSSSCPACESDFSA
jgi:hypothetical protein